MTYAAVAFCPHPPLLASAVGAQEPVAVREPALASVRWLTSQQLSHLLILGAGAAPQIYQPGSRGSFRGYGVDLSVQLPGHPSESAPTDLPLPLSVAAWLLEQAEWSGPTYAMTCGPDAALPATPPAGERPGLLVMGDGSARRTEKAPGWLDERAGDYDEAIAEALASGDPDGLRTDLDLAQQLLAAGAPAWAAAAGLLGGTRWEATVSYADTPYGVGYFVATWSAG